MNIIGIVGLIGSGKDTVAEILVEHGFVRDSFAKPLKDLTAAVFGWPRDMLEGNTPESRAFRETTDLFWSRKLGIENFTPRLALQRLGTDLFRKQFQDGIWRHSLEYRLRCNANQNIAISDARFRNEIELIHNMSGKVIWVQRDELPAWWETACDANAGSVTAHKLMLTTYKHIHESEWNWAGAKMDFVIQNNSTIAHLRQQVADIYSEIIQHNTD